MNYEELAKQFLNNSYRYRNCGHQKKFDDNLHGEAFTMLYIYKEGGNVLPSDISNEMNISSARVAFMLNNLENKGLISRKIDSNDRRKILVTLTTEGLAYAQIHNDNVTNHTIKMLTLLGEHDAKELVRIIGKLVDICPKIINKE